MARPVCGADSLPLPGTPDWRLQVAQAMIRSAMSGVVSYLHDAGDLSPLHTAAQAIWREAIETTAEAVPVANDNTLPAPRERPGEELLD